MRATTLAFRSRPISALVIATLLLLVLLASPRATAQAESPADLRRENDNLRNRVSQLEAANKKLDEEATRLRERVSQLESQLARLQAENTKLRNRDADAPADSAPAPESTGGEPQANLPDDPLACPPSLLRALKTKYEEEFDDRAITPETRSDYIKDVRRWALDMKREFRDRITWTVEIDPAGVPGDEKIPVKLRVVDPDSRDAYHADPVAIDLGYRNTRRIMSEPNQRYWVLEGVFFADPNVNPNRDRPGALDYPPFIGPFAEFAYGLSVRSVTPAQSRPTP